MTLTWLEPTSNGACPITGYSLLIDDGSSGAPTVQVSGMATDLPTLRSTIITFASSSLGTTFTFKLGASNRQGSTESATVSYLFAVAPSKPPSGPTVVSSGSSSIRVQYDQPLGSEGGSPPISYNLQYMPVHTRGEWIDLAGGSFDTLRTSFTISTGLVLGETYFFRYRVKNSAAWGGSKSAWGEFSEASTVVAADAPGKPASAPTIVGDPTASSVTLQFELETIDDRGSPATAFHLEICEVGVPDTCLTDAAFSPVASYNTGYAQHTLTDATDSLASGSTYRLRYRAENAHGGLGIPSDTLTVALVDKPAAPASLSKTMVYSSKTSLRIEWDPVSVPAG